MKKLSLSISIILCFAVNLLLLAPSAFAAEPVLVELPVSIRLSGALPEKAEEFNLVFQPDAPSYPMPLGSGEEYHLMLKGAETKALPPISFSKVGKFSYMVYQRAGANPQCDYDATVYHFTVTVSEDETGALTAVSVLHKAGVGEKQANLVFENTYKAEQSTMPGTTNAVPGTTVLETTARPFFPQADPDHSLTGANLHIALPLFLVAIAAITLIYLQASKKKERER